MKSMIKRALLPSFLISLFLASCNVTPDGFWSGDSNVNHRFSGLKKLSESDAEVKSWDEEEKYHKLYFPTGEVNVSTERLTQSKLKM